MESKATGKIILGLAVVGLGILAIKYFRKKYKKIEEIEKKETEELEALGVSREKLQNDMIPEIDDNNLVKRLYHSVKFNTSWDEDLLDMEGFLNNENVIHVRQSDTNDALDFLIEIPEIALEDEDRPSSPKIGEYITHCSSARDFMWKDIIGEGECPRPYSELEGYFVVAYNIEGCEEEQYRIVKVPDRLYQEYATDRHNGLTEYIKLVRARVIKGKPDKREIFARYKYDGEEDVLISDVRVIHIYCMYRISFPISKLMDNGKMTPGIDLPKALRCLRFLVNEFSVTRGSLIKTYDYLIFHAPGDYEEWNLLWYYTTTVVKKNGTRKRIIIEDNYVY